MQPVIYDVAVSIDGFIDGPDGGVSRFPHRGAIVEDYVARLSTYRYALMGRETYSFGMANGLPPGANPYPGTTALVFSTSIELPEGADVQVVRTDAPAFVSELKQTASGPIYLCGGGALAGSLARAGLIDRLRLKRAPIVLGGGTPLFGPDGAELSLDRLEVRPYESGALYLEFAVN